jgi:RNA polymerase sigma-70 factor, ECF subfamily
LAESACIPDLQIRLPHLVTQFGQSAKHARWILCTYLRLTRKTLAKIGHGPTEAEDLVQEVLISIHTHRHTYDQSQPFTPWVHAIARHKFLDYLRRTKSSYNDIAIDRAEDLVAHSDMSAIESGLDLKRLMSNVSWTV